jgi:hypothetical protein
MTIPPVRAFRTTPRDPRMAESPASHLGKALTVEGFLETDGDLHMHGRVFGWVCADRLVLSSRGYLNGDVVARAVHFGGRLTGPIFAINVAGHIGRCYRPDFSPRSHGRRGARVDAGMPRRPPSYFESFKQIPEPRP